MTSPAERNDSEPSRRLDVRGSGLESSAILDRLPDTSLWQLTVADTLELTPSMRRIRFSAPNLGSLSYVPGQDLMFAVPTEDGRTFRRRYTIRRLAHDGLLDIDFVLHGDGPGARWAARAARGDTIEAIGPRGKIAPDPEASWHLFSSDESALPATFAMVEALEPGASAIALIEVDGPEDEQVLEPPGAVHLDLRWLHRDGVPAGRSTVLADMVANLPLPTGQGHVYLNGELRTVNAARAQLLERGIGAEHVSLKSYWRFGAANAAHGEPARD